MNIRKYIISKLVKKEEQIIDSKKYTDALLQINELQAKLRLQPLTAGELTMMQLGSYLPSFKTLDGQTDDFKNNIARMCYGLAIGQEWKYLIEHLKQDQVNTTLFNLGEETKSDEFMRGSINGIYIVDELISRLGASYQQKISDSSNIKK